MNTDKLPPNDIPAEQALLGCIIMDARTVLLDMGGRIKSAEVFFDGRHQLIYETILKLSDAGVDVGLVALSTKLKDSDSLDRVGGIPYLSAILDSAPLAGAWEFFLETVLGCYARRRILAISAQLAQDASNGEISTSDNIDAASHAITELGTEFSGEQDTSIKGFAKQSLAFFESCFDRKGALAGVSTGFTDLDRLTTGLKPGEMFVIAARPGHGKTAIAMNIAEHVGIKEKSDIGIFSLEMTGRQITDRMICSHGRIDLSEITDGRINKEDVNKLTSSMLAVCGARIRLDATGQLTIQQIRARARKMHQQHGIKLLIVDYLQLIKTPNGKNSRESEVAAVSAGLKGLLKELNIPGIILAQLNRGVEKDKSRKPNMADLRESGAIEQDADLVGLLYSPDPKPDGKLILEVNMRICKNRSGRTGEVKFIFRKQFTRFEQATL